MRLHSRTASPNRAIEVQFISTGAGSAATEFQIQGLELDWICMTWDADLRMRGQHWRHHRKRRTEGRAPMPGPSVAVACEAQKAYRICPARSMRASC